MKACKQLPRHVLNGYPALVLALSAKRKGTVTSSMLIPKKKILVVFKRIVSLEYQQEQLTSSLPKPHRSELFIGMGAPHCNSRTAEKAL
ncbi:MAG: hypothetical protein ACJAS3_003042 [Roseivirga sp.]|jgi:hypothetical protein